ncbi:MAG TPA: hypothetical protein VGS20_11910 [Candidatus Acidoferrales bacterium]|nr:hypothetical protein [Candidatus Acidoferrales bacterium]
MALKHESWDEPDWDKPKPPRRNDSLGVVIFLLTAAIIMAAIFVPSLSQPLRKMLQPPSRPKLDVSITVWVQRDAGTYQCSDSRLYGKGDGSYMKQGEALTAGYQPALGDYCNQVLKTAASPRGASKFPLESGQQTTAASKSSSGIAGQRP